MTSSTTNIPLTQFCSNVANDRLPRLGSYAVRLVVQATAQASASYAMTAGLLLALCLLGCAHKQSVPTSSNSDWHEFEGTWTAAGNRYVLQIGDHRRASIAHLDGSLVLSGPQRPNLGFRSEIIVLTDSATGLIGRAVWTDEHGDNLFSELRGAGSSTNNNISGTFVGGTGRYSAVTGTYEFSWQFLLETEDGIVQGQSVGLKGRARLGSPTETGDAGK